MARAVVAVRANRLSLSRLMQFVTRDSRWSVPKEKIQNLTPHTPPATGTRKNTVSNQWRTSGGETFQHHCMEKRVQGRSSVPQQSQTDEATDNPPCGRCKSRHRAFSAGNSALK